MKTIRNTRNNAKKSIKKEIMENLGIMNMANSSEILSNFEVVDKFGYGLEYIEGEHEEFGNAIFFTETYYFTKGIKTIYVYLCFRAEKEDASNAEKAECYTFDVI